MFAVQILGSLKNADHVHNSVEEPSPIALFGAADSPAVVTRPPTWYILLVAKLGSRHKQRPYGSPMLHSGRFLPYIRPLPVDSFVMMDVNMRLLTLELDVDTAICSVAAGAGSQGANGVRLTVCIRDILATRNVSNISRQSNASNSPLQWVPDCLQWVAD